MLTPSLFFSLSLFEIKGNVAEDFSATLTPESTYSEEEEDQTEEEQTEEESMEEANRVPSPPATPSSAASPSQSVFYHSPVPQFPQFSVQFFSQHQALPPLAFTSSTTATPVKTHLQQQPYTTMVATSMTTQCISNSQDYYYDDDARVPENEQTLASLQPSPSYEFLSDLCQCYEIRDTITELGTEDWTIVEFDFGFSSI